MEEVRSLNQSLLRGGDKFWEFCSYNPPKSIDSWVNGEAEVEEEDKLIHHSTYLDVPKKWLGTQFYIDAERLRARNETAYNHEYLGKVVGTGGAVFENVEHLEMDDAMIQSFGKMYYGLDFGLTYQVASAVMPSIKAGEPRLLGCAA